MKITIIGHFAENQNFNDGQTVKTRNLYKELAKVYKKNVAFVDTYNYKAHPIKLLKKCINAIKSSDYLIILPAMNGIKIFVPLFTLLNKKYKHKLIYAVVGGWLPEFLISKKFLQKKVKQLDKILVETNSMKEKLNKMQITNVDILFNFKNIKPLEIEELKYNTKDFYRVCTFSRVIKEKGIENAINVVQKINKKYGKMIYQLDIYGPIAQEYKDEFENLINSANLNYVSYKGVVDSDKSVDTIKNYDLLLFPTYYKGEGLAGTVIDAFFAGVPIVASDWRYNSDIIKDKVNGFIFKTQDDYDMEVILDEIYNEKYNLKEMKINCLEESKKYLPDVAVKPLIDYIECNSNIKRLLCIVSSMDRGGAETFLMKLYRKLNREKYQFDFCVSNSKPGFYDEEIKNMGGKIFVVPAKSKSIIKSYKAIKKIVKQERYNSVLRTSQRALACLDLIAAKNGGAKKLIFRSSNAGVTSKKEQYINRLFGFLPKIVPNVKIAPSTEAATFVFGKKAVENNKVFIMHNCLDYNLFKFNTEIRNKIRKQLNIENKTVYGHIGRYNIQKNHKFLLNIFNCIKQKDKNSILLIIGEGELEEQIKNEIKRLELENNVLMIGAQKNVNEYLMAMDTFIFPSFFEGMPNVIIEAQATGLPCVLSNTITKEAKITNLLTYVSLDESAETWSNIAMEKSKIVRKDFENEFKQKGYIIEEKIEEYVGYLF